MTYYVSSGTLNLTKPKPKPTPVISLYVGVFNAMPSQHPDVEGWPLHGDSGYAVTPRNIV